MTPARPEPAGPALGRARLLAMLWAAHAARRPGRLLMSIAVVAVGVALGLGVNLVNHSALQEFQASLARINGEADMSLRARRYPGRSGLGAARA